MCITSNLRTIVPKLKFQKRLIKLTHIFVPLVLVQSLSISRSQSYILPINPDMLSTSVPYSYKCFTIISIDKTDVWKYWSIELFASSSLFNSTSHRPTFMGQGWFCWINTNMREKDPAVGKTCLVFDSDPYPLYLLSAHSIK